MNTLERFKWIVVSMAVALGLAACNKPNTAETAGQKIDRAADKAGDKMERAENKLGAQSEKAGEAFDDGAITAKVKAAIFAEETLKVLQINVDTVQGVVTLSGTVDSQQESDTAKKIAGAVAGVKKVENKLAVKSTGT